MYHYNRLKSYIMIKSTPKLIKEKRTRTELFGSADDPEIRERIARMKRAGHVITLKPSQGYATGFGPCGKHLCHCTENCEKL